MGGWSGSRWASQESSARIQSIWESWEPRGGRGHLRPQAAGGGGAAGQPETVGLRAQPGGWARPDGAGHTCREQAAGQWSHLASTRHRLPPFPSVCRRRSAQEQPPERRGSGGKEPVVLGVLGGLHQPLRVEGGGLEAPTARVRPSLMRSLALFPPNWIMATGRGAAHREGLCLACSAPRGLSPAPQARPQLAPCPPCWSSSICARCPRRPPGPPLTPSCRRARTSVPGCGLRPPPCPRAPPRAANPAACLPRARPACDVLRQNSAPGATPWRGRTSPPPPEPHAQSTDTSTS